MLINAGMTHWSDRGLRSAFGVSRWIDGLSGRDAVIEYLYGTTLNINGIFAGQAMMTIVPHEATAHVDSRLPPGMDPDEAMAKIRAHLDSNDFTDVETRQTDGYPASLTSVEAPPVQVALSVVKKYTAIHVVHPWSAGSAPFHLFTERLGLPLVPFGLGFGFGAHGPNEYMVIEPGPGVHVAGLDDIEKAYVDLIYALASQRQG